MKLKQISLSDVVPNKDNPRGINIATEDEKLSYLMDSIKQFGVMVPIVVTPRGGRYFLIDGERRYHAARAVGLDRIPAYVLETHDGRGLSDSELLFRMFQIHHLREQWGAVQQCHALEETYAHICKHPAIRKMHDDREKYNAVVSEMATVTGIDSRTAGDRVKFLRWPKRVKQRLYRNPDEDRGAYSYILEIEDKIILPALTNYPEYFEKVSVDDIREDLFSKLEGSLAYAQEVRQVAPYFRTTFSKAADRNRVTRVLTKLAKNCDMSYEEARESLEKEFPDVAMSDAPTPKRLLGMLGKLESALSQFDIETVKKATKRAKVDPEEIVATANSLREALAELIDELEGLAENE
jgi:hypothetical protein